MPVICSMASMFFLRMSAMAVCMGMAMLQHFCRGGFLAMLISAALGLLCLLCMHMGLQLDILPPYRLLCFQNLDARLQSKYLFAGFCHNFLAPLGVQLHGHGFIDKIHGAGRNTVQLFHTVLNFQCAVGAIQPFKYQLPFHCWCCGFHIVHSLPTIYEQLLMC
ncbi:hypothetical protein D3C75_550040 [compost metagenome]